MTSMGRCVANTTWEVMHWRLIAPSWQCPCSFCFICARIQLNNGKTNVMHQPYPPTSSILWLYFFYWNTSWHWREGHFMTSGKFMNNCRLHFKNCKQRMQQILQATAQVCYIKNKILTRNSITMSHIFPTKWVQCSISETTEQSQTRNHVVWHTSIYHTALWHNPLDHKLHTHHLENLKYHRFGCNLKLWVYTQSR